MTFPELVYFLFYLKLSFHDLLLNLINLLLKDLKWIALVEWLVLAHSFDQFAEHDIFWVDVVSWLYFCSLLFGVGSICGFEPMRSLRVLVIWNNDSAEHEEVNLVDFGDSIFELLILSFDHRLFFLNYLFS